MRIILFILLICTCTMALSSCNSKPSNKVDDKNDAHSTINVISGNPTNATTVTEDSASIVYIPQYSKIDLVCGTMPSTDDKHVILCAEAAYTGELLHEFKHSNILGDHVSSGKRYKGTPNKRNTGAFVYYKRKYKFLYKNYSKELDSAVKYGGMGFGQEMLIHKGELVPCMRKDNNQNEFRALCELNQQLCIIDSRGVVKFIDFKNALLRKGVTEALYLDMGSGWNYSWYRDNKNIVHTIYPKTHSYTTNWITFYN